MSHTSRLDTEAISAGLLNEFASDVHYYLSLRPRQLPSKYFYDALGSALFDAICQLPWYPLMRAEMRLLAAHGADVLGDVSTILELGPGNGAKLATLIRAAASRRGALDIHLVDASGSALAVAETTLGRFADVRIFTQQAAYETGLETFAPQLRGPGRALVMFLGSNIGNFDPPAREALLRTIRRALARSDRLLIGADLVKPQRNLLLAYDDPLGVTAAFNLNLLARINRELHANFDLNGFAHSARWSAKHSRVEMHLASTRRQHVVVRAADLEFDILEGETIWTESSYKYEVSDIASLLSRCGFQVNDQWVEPDDRFALTHAVAV